MKNFKKYLSNIPGWRINRKIIVFESDDWGSIRMPSSESFEKLKSAGLNLRSRDAERYNLNDTLATAEDLEKLFEVITTVKDKNGHPAVFTPVTIVANPDFQKIKESDFNEYFYEPFTETLKRYPGCEKSFELWLEGINKQIFIPQLHGREHLNVTTWMNALRMKDNQAHLAFNEGVWGYVPETYPLVDYQAAFLPYSPHEIEYHKEIISDGIKLFKKIFGYQAEYFVPPNGYFNNSLNHTLAKNGIKYRSASKMQVEPLGNGKFRRVFHWLGQKDKDGIRYITRNCSFEPSQPGKDWIDSCLHDIKNAFHFHKPAIISTHRVNYIGSLNKGNRDNGLLQLKKLLFKITREWPDIEFMTTPHLGMLIVRKNGNN
jgi:hypothetical protein